MSKLRPKEGICQGLCLSSSCLTKYHKPGGLKNVILSQFWMLLVLGQGASMIRLGTAFFLACRWPSSQCPHRQRESVWKHASCLLSLLIRALIHCEVPTHMTSSKLNYLSKATSPNNLTLGLGIQHMNLWGKSDTTQSITISKLVRAEQGLTDQL